MPLTAKVVPGETFPDNENVTRAKLRNAANPSVTIENSLSNVEVASNAGVQLSKLEGVTEGALLVGSATNNAANASLKAIAAVTMPASGNNTGGSVNSTTGITPSNNTVDHDSLRKSQSENIIRGARDLGYCEVNGTLDDTKTSISACEAVSGGEWKQEAVTGTDHVLLCNVSADANTEQNGDAHDNLRRVSVSNLLKSTFTTQVALTDLTSGGLVAADATKTVDLDSNPVQAIACTTPSAGTGTEYTLTIKFSNLPDSGFAKNIMLVVFNLTSTDSVKLSFEAPSNGKVRFIGSTPPAKLGAGKAGVMAVTGWPNSNVLIGYSAEV